MWWQFLGRQTSAANYFWMVQNFSTFLSDGRGLNPYLYTIGLKSQVAFVPKPMTYEPAKTHGVIFEHGNIWGHCVSEVLRQ